MRVLRLVVMMSLAARAAVAEPPAGATSCSGCHIASTNLETPVPPIRGRDPTEIIAVMQEFRSGKRPATVMGRIAKGFSDDEIRQIAAWLATQH